MEVGEEEFQENFNALNGKLQKMDSNYSRERTYPHKNHVLVHTLTLYPMFYFFLKDMGCSI